MASLMYEYVCGCRVHRSRIYLSCIAVFFTVMVQHCNSRARDNEYLVMIKSGERRCIVGMAKPA